MALKRKLRIFNNGKSRNPKPTSFFFSASLLPPPKKPKLFQLHRVFSPRQRTPWFSQTGPPLPPLLPTPHLLPSLPPLLPTPPHLGRLGASHSQSILGKVPAKLRHLALRKRHQVFFKTGTSKNNHHLGKAQFPQEATANARHHASASVSRTVKGGIQKKQPISPSHLSSIDVKVGSPSIFNVNVYSPTTPAEKRLVYSTQELLACRFQSQPSKEILLGCERLNILLGVSRLEARPCPPPSSHWVPYCNQRTNQVRLFKREFGNRKCHRSEVNSAHSGPSKRFRSLQKEIGRPLFVFQANSLQQSLKLNNQGKRKSISDGKGQPLKRQKLERPGGVIKKWISLTDTLAIQVQVIGKTKSRRSGKGGPLFSHSKGRKSALPGVDLLSSVFALFLLFIFSLWRLLLYNSQNGRGGSSALSRHAPSPSGSSEVVPQQPSSHP